MVPLFSPGDTNTVSSDYNSKGLFHKGNGPQSVYIHLRRYARQLTGAQEEKY